MALIRTVGGKEPTLTTLWTNPSPSASFTEQTVNLSDNITNYDEIQINYVGAAGADEYYIKVKTLSPKTSAPIPCGALGYISATIGAGTDRARLVMLGSAANIIEFYQCVTATTGSGSSHNENCIPTSIVGVKY